MNLGAIFKATMKAKDGANGAGGRDLIRKEHRVFFMLCFHTAARPASEPGRLRHGDVKFLSDGWAEVTYRHAKNIQSNRTIPVPPEVAGALKNIMLPTPFDDAERAVWGETPVFRKRGSGAPWNQYSYNKAWAAVRSVAPGIENMWVRDLRATAKTWLRKSGIRTSVAMRFMGHKARTVHDEYDNVDADDLRVAAEALRLEKLASLLAASQEPHNAHTKRTLRQSL